MIIDNNARTILRNFATINPSLLVRPGSELRTISPSKCVMAIARLDQSFDQTFGIYDLSQFLATVALFESPTLTPVEGSHMMIEEGSESVRYMFAAPNLIIAPPQKDIQLSSVDVSFDLPASVLSKAIRAMGTLGAPQLSFTGDGQSVFLCALDHTNSSKSVYRAKIAETDKKFNIIVLSENVKMLSLDYKVSISKSGPGPIRLYNDQIEYWIAAEKTSTFG